MFALNRLEVVRNQYCSVHRVGRSSYLRRINLRVPSWQRQRLPLLPLPLPRPRLSALLLATVCLCLVSQTTARGAENAWDRLRQHHQAHGYRENPQDIPSHSIFIERCRRTVHATWLYWTESRNTSNPPAWRSYRHNQAEKLVQRLHRSPLQRLRRINSQPHGTDISVLICQVERLRESATCRLAQPGIRPLPTSIHTGSPSRWPRSGFDGGSSGEKRMEVLYDGVFDEYAVREGESAEIGIIPKSLIDGLDSVIGKEVTVKPELQWGNFDPESSPVSPEITTLLTVALQLPQVRSPIQSELFSLTDIAEIGSLLDLSEAATTLIPPTQENQLSQKLRATRELLPMQSGRTQWPFLSRQYQQLTPVEKALSPYILEKNSEVAFSLAMTQGTVHNLRFSNYDSQKGTLELFSMATPHLTLNLAPDALKGLRALPSEQAHR